MFAGAHIRRLGARAIADAVVALDDDAADAAPSELDGRRKADRAGADDQDVGVPAVRHRRVFLAACAHGVGRPIGGMVSGA